MCRPYKADPSTLFRSGRSANAQSGRFDVDVAAEQLGLDPNYARGLFMDRSCTFTRKGAVYPAETYRSARPNSDNPAQTRRKMFPLHQCGGRKNPWNEKAYVKPAAMTTE